MRRFLSLLGVVVQAASVTLLAGIFLDGLDRVGY